MDVVPESEIVGQHGRADPRGEASRTGRKQGHQAGDGDATAGAWLGGRTTRCRPDRGSRQGAARTIDNTRPMAMPATCRGDGGLGRLTPALPAVCEHADGAPGAGLTVRRGPARDAGARGARATGRVAMEQRQPAHRYGEHRIQEAVTPRAIPDGCTRGVAHLGCQWGRPIGCEAVEDRRDTGSPESSPRKNRGGAPLLPAASRVCQSSSRPGRKSVTA